MMSPDERKKLDEVHAAIVGNASLGNKGVINRLQELEEYKKKRRSL